MEKQIEHAAGILKKTILKSETYRNYLNSTLVLQKSPGLLERIEELRKATIQTYHDPDNQDLAESSDRLLEQYGELERNPAVSAYLEAEDELIRTLRNVQTEIIGDLEVHSPQI